MPLAPICLFTYKRLECTQQTIQALQQNNLASKSKLFIFSDAAKKEEDKEAVQQVRKYIRQIKGFEEINILEKEKNMGLAKSIIGGVNQVIQADGRVIVLEDDIQTSPNFLDFMNQALEAYKDNQTIFSIAGYTFPIKFPKNYNQDVYLAPRASSWGWASWADRWVDIDWEVKDFEDFSKSKNLIHQFNQGGSDMYAMLRKQMQGKIDSWAIRWGYHQFKQKQMTVFPTVSKVQNLGFGDNASNTKFYNRFATVLDEGKQNIFSFPQNIHPNTSILKAFKSKNSLKTRILGRLKYYLGLK